MAEPFYVYPTSAVDEAKMTKSLLSATPLRLRKFSSTLTFPLFPSFETRRKIYICFFAKPISSTSHQKPKIRLVSKILIRLPFPMKGDPDSIESILDKNKRVVNGFFACIDT